MPMMQFFTDDLFEAGESHAAYEQYCTANRKRLLYCLLRINHGMLPDHFFPSFDDAIGLHDACLQNVDAELPNVKLHLHGDNCGALREIFLHYTGVSKFSPIPDVLLADEPCSALMCHETTVVTDDKFNHKMLFASSDILSIDFTALGVRVVDHPLPS